MAVDSGPTSVVAFETLSYDTQSKAAMVVVVVVDVELVVAAVTIGDELASKTAIEPVVVVVTTLAVEMVLAAEPATMVADSASIPAASHF